MTATVEPTTQQAVKHTVVHVEIPAKDAVKLKAFYQDVFGWQFAAPPGMDDYYMASTTGDSNGAGVAIFPVEAARPPINYVGVASVKEHIARIVANGGTLQHEFTVDFMGHGAMLLDPEGNPLGLWQDDPSARS